VKDLMKWKKFENETLNLNDIIKQKSILKKKFQIGKKIHKTPALMHKKTIEIKNNDILYNKLNI